MSESNNTYTTYPYICALISARSETILEEVRARYPKDYFGRSMPDNLSFVTVLYIRKNEACKLGQSTVWKVGLVPVVVGVDKQTKESVSNIVICHLNSGGSVENLTTERCIFYQGQWERSPEHPAAV